MKTADFLNLLCESMNRDPGTLTLEDTPETVEQWDSVGHLSIISAIDQLGVAVDNDEMQNFASIRELVNRLKQRGALED